jgi:undecaprenyl-diphosphatase
MLLVIAVASYMVAVRNVRSALLLVGAVVSGGILSETLKLGFDRPRPDLVAHMAHATSSSFPSGHAMLSAVVYLTLGAVLVRLHDERRMKTLIMTFAILITVLIGASRVYLGVHWPTDVLAGWIMGAVWSALWWILVWKLQRSDKNLSQPTG